MNNKLPEWRKTLNKSVENYQSTQAWYEENPDNPSAEQDMNAAEGDIEKLLKQYGVLIVLSLMDEIDELQEREQIRREHAEWSDVTFGDVGPVGPLKHLSKEALEAAAEPEDLSEWADMQFLLWDAQRRAGISDEQITQAMVEKLAVNKQREWPEPKDGEPRLHIKAQPVSVVPDGLRQALSNAGIAAPESDEMLAATCEKYIQMLVTWVKDRKPFQPAPVMPEEITDESTEQRLMGRHWAHSFCAGWNACRAAMLKGDAK
ncbi:dATP/dGTP pyrophosphohydrolase domain-containing protein [Salmonella enterica]